MKKLLYIIMIFVFACNSEDANDCFQTSGSIVQEVIQVAEFDKILVNRDVELVITEAQDYKVTIETGENLLNDVKVKVEGNILILTDNNTCNYVRDYGITKMYVETPNLTEIINSSQYDVSSIGILSFPNLNLISENFNGSNEFTVGDYRLTIDNQRLNVASNGLSSFYINGETENLKISFFAGAGRFEGESLEAENVEINHRGSNDMIVNPIQVLTGVIRGTGDVISVNQPPLVEVEEIYTGELIFQ